MRKLFVCFIVLFVAVTGVAKVKRYNDIPNMPAPSVALSIAAQVGDVIFLSGQLGSDPKTGKLVQSSYADEVGQTLENVKTIVEGLGGSLNDVVKLTIFLTDMNDYAETNRMVEQYFEGHYPAREIIGINALVGEAKVEISAVMAVAKP